MQQAHAAKCKDHRETHRSSILISRMRVVKDVVQKLFSCEKYHCGATVCCAYFANAMMYMIIGPTMLDIAQQTSSSYEEASHAVVTREISFLIGSLTFGCLFVRCISNRVTLMVTLLLSGLATLAVPFTSSVHVFMMLQGIVGFMIAGLDVSATVWMREIGCDQAHAYSQAMHASYAIGQMLIPMICAPFLSSRNRTSTLLARSPLNSEEASDSRIVFPYLIAASVGLVTSLGILVLHIKKSFAGTAGKMNEDADIDVTRPTEPVQVKDVTSRRYLIVTILLTCLFAGSYSGMEQDTLTFLPQFVFFNNFNVSRKTAALMASVLSAAFALVRCLSILFASRKASPHLMLCCNMVITITGNIILLNFSKDQGSHPLTWMALVLLGTGLSSSQAATNAFVGKRTRMTNTLVGLMLFCGRLVSIVSAYFIPLWIEASPLILVQTNLIYLCVSCFALLAFFANDAASRSTKANEQV